MKLIVLIFVIFTLHEAFADNSQELYESKCIECHSRMTGGDGHVIYSRDDRIAKDYSQLRARVSHCAKGSNTNWTESQIESVTNYLNELYYRY